MSDTNREKVYLLIGGGDGFDAQIVRQSELDDAFVGLHFGQAKDAPEEERKAMLDHLHDDDNWERNHELGNVRYSVRYEDGYVEVVQLTGGIGERMASWRSIRAIEDERLRQVHDEGWDAAHDDEHWDGGLALAAACYASLAAAAAQNGSPAEVYQAAEPPFRWPWERKWWKPKNPRRDLVRAAALIVAELDRIDRKAPAASTATNNG